MRLRKWPSIFAELEEKYGKEEVAEAIQTVGGADFAEADGADEESRRPGRHVRDRYDRFP